MKDALTRRYELPSTFLRLYLMKPLGDAAVGPLGAAWRAGMERWKGGRERTGVRRAQKATALALKMRRRHVMKAEKRARRRAENIAKLAEEFNAIFARTP